MTKAKTPKGYSKKPLWIYGLGLAFILAPFGNFLWSLAALGVKRWWDPAVWSIWLPYVEWHVWILMSLVSVSGFCLLLVRKWSWLLSLVSLFMVLVYSVALLPEINSKASIGIIAMLMFMTIGAIGVVFLSPFRLPYINPRLRWWETSPRYKVEIQVNVGDFSEHAVLIDVSRTGALVEWHGPNRPETLDSPVKLSLPMGLVLFAELARKTDRGYGFRFLSGSINKESQKALKAFLAQLDKDPTKLVRK